MNRRNFIQILGLGGALLSLLSINKVEQFGLVDAEKNIGPHRNVEVFLNDHKITNCTAANDAEGWADIVDPFHKKQYSNKQRYYGNVEIRWKS